MYSSASLLLLLTKNQKMDIVSFQQLINPFMYPVLIVMLLGTGLFLTIRLGFIQFKRLGHGVRVAMGKYDDPDDPGDVSHFQALTTALSATVGIGNIAGVAIAIHFGGPGAIFWMWVTAMFGMATKYTEVTLAQQYREISPGSDGSKGTISGGPMYYIEKGLGKKWKPMAAFVAFGIMLTAFLSGNAIQANSIADLFNSEFNIPMWMSGLGTAAFVGLVILGGIQRIGKVTSVIAPIMALLYVVGGITVLVINADMVWPAFRSIFVEAFNPSAGIAGTGAGLFIQTLLWGVRRGLFSNEAGQGSAPIAHSAAKTKDPSSEGVVALLEPFIDTIIICTITALVILTAGVWKETTPTTFRLNSGDVAYIEANSESYSSVRTDATHVIIIEAGKPQLTENDTIQFAWHEVPVEDFYIDEERQQTFTGKLYPERQLAIADDGTTYDTLYGLAMENAAPLTQLAYTSALGRWGTMIVLLCVFLFGISTSISWSYYGDRCVNYLFGAKMILPYKAVYVIMHFVGAVTSLNTIWGLGDTVLAFITIPNVLALLLLSGVAKKLTDEYFEKIDEAEKK